MNLEIYDNIVVYWVLEVLFKVGEYCYFVYILLIVIGLGEGVIDGELEVIIVCVIRI